MSENKLLATIFIVDDEKSINSTLSLNLELEGYSTIQAFTGKEALEKYRKHSGEIDLVLLDIMLPELSGFELINSFRSINSQVPIFFLTAKDERQDKISGLKLGATDYISKPFDLEELLLRIKNTLESKPSLKFPNQYKIDNAQINFETFEIRDLHGNVHLLSKREIGLLKLLINNPNKVISRDEIIDSLWEDSENASSRTIDNYILNFRKYFEENPKEPKYFQSIRGVGYKLVI